MKKIFAMVVMAAAFAMVSCGGNPNKKAAEAETRSEQTECCEGECCGECEGECCKKECCAETEGCQEACCEQAAEE